MYVNHDTISLGRIIRKNAKNRIHIRLRPNCIVSRYVINTILVLPDLEALYLTLKGIASHLVDT